MIPYGRHEITPEDIREVVAVLESDFLTQGPAVPRFEAAVTGFVGSKYGVAVNSATSALHIACIALGLGPGDYLWTSAITFVASANCGLYCGAMVDFVDIDPITYNMSIEALARKLEQAEIDGKLPKIVVPVHLCGLSADMKAIHNLSMRYGFKIIEDASHAIGGKYLEDYIGGCRYSDITVFSFHPVKIITTAEGGIAVTNNEQLAEHMILLRGHGITRDQAKMIYSPDGPWYYEQIDLGFNFRMTDLQAALGLSQIKRLESYISRRNEIAAGYDLLLKNLPLLTPAGDIKCISANHLYVVLLQLEGIRRTHREVFELLRNSNIGVNLHYIPIYRHPHYKNIGYDKKLFINSEWYYARALSLPIYPSLSVNQQYDVVDALRSALEI